ncbi:protoporphyrinogen oxidase [bacterium]|nr:protoporphyrinogen oxidase [bacterium]
METNEKVDVGILGGGVTGLACGWWLQRSSPQTNFALWEANDRAGGRIASRREQGYLLESGPDSFMLQRPAMLELIRGLGLEERMCASKAGQAGTYIKQRQRLRPLPAGLHLGIPSRPWTVAFSPLLSLRGKLRLAMEPLVPSQPAAEDESLGSFVRRRLGQEALNQLVGPLVGGIFGTDLERLSLRATFAHLADYEKNFGSLTKALWKSPVPRAGTGFYSFMGGMQELVDALTAALNSRVSTGVTADSVELCEDGWRVRSAQGQEMRCRQLVLALPSRQAAQLLGNCCPEVSRRLNEFGQGSAAAVQLGWRRRQVRNRLPGYGFVCSYPCDDPLVACTWSSQKFAGRAPDQGFLMRAFLRDSGSFQVEHASQPELIERALSALRKPLGLTGAPELVRVERYSQAFPHYYTGHLARVRDLKMAVQAHPGLHCLGAAYAAGGIPACVTQARQWVEEFSHG